VAGVRDALRAAEVEIDGVALVLDEEGGDEEGGRIIGGKVGDQRPVGGARLELARAVLGVGRELFAHHHRRVGEVGAVAAAQQPEGELRAADHGRENACVRGQRTRGAQRDRGGGGGGGCGGGR
jgi:hypothetical protein